MAKILRDADLRAMDDEKSALERQLDEAMAEIDRAADLADSQQQYAALVESALDQLNQRIDYITWQPITESSSNELAELPMDERKKLIRIARQFWLKDPLMHQAVALTTQYTFGEGLRYSSNLDDVMQEVEEFWVDEDNQLELTSYQAQEQKSNELQVDGEIFFVLFVDPDLRVKVRTLPPEEITEILCSPDDYRRPLYYERRFTTSSYDVVSRRWQQGQTQTQYYADWRNYAVGQWGFDGPIKPVDGVVYHVALNRVSWQKRGYTEMYPALDWAKAHRQLLQDWVTIVKAYSTLAWKAKIRGDDPRDIDRVRARLKAMLPTFSQNPNEPWAPSGTGGVQIENDNVTMSPIKTAGMATSPDDARQIRLMAGAGMGIMEHYFGDAGNANLATATAMELPMLKKFAARQRLWESVYSNILTYVVTQGIEAGRISSVQVQEHEDARGRIVNRRMITDGQQVLSVKAPPILRSDLKSVSDAMETLMASNLIPAKEASRYAMNAMDLPNTEALLIDMYGEGGAEPMAPEEEPAPAETPENPPAEDTEPPN